MSQSTASKNIRVRIENYSDGVVAYLERWTPDCDGWYWEIEKVCTMANVGPMAFAETVAVWAQMSLRTPVTHDTEANDGSDRYCVEFSDDDQDNLEG